MTNNAKTAVVLIPHETASYCYALLGAANEAEAVAVWARNPEARYEAHKALMTASPAQPASRTEGEAVEGWHVEAIHEAMAESGGFWAACSGCQEGVDGCVSSMDYPYSRVFKCQPGAGCTECGGLGVLWDNTDYDQMAREMLADDEARLASPPQAVSGDVGSLQPQAASVPGDTTADRAASPCGCNRCVEEAVHADGGDPMDPRLIRYFLCETCGNKRCPHAADHRNTCTTSNEPGQPGSNYP